MQMQLAAQFQQSAGASLSMIILVLVLGLLFFILAGYQLLAGLLILWLKPLKKAVQFSDLFFAFKKENMLKSSFSFYYYYCLCCIIFNHIRLNFLFNKALTPLFTSIQQSVSTSDHAIGIFLLYKLS